MNAFTAGAIINVAVVAGGVYLAMNDHPVLAFFVIALCMCSVKTKRKCDCEEKEKE